MHPDSGNRLSESQTIVTNFVDQFCMLVDVRKGVGRATETVSPDDVNFLIWKAMSMKANTSNNTKQHKHIFV